MTITVHTGQDIFDIAVIAYGDASKAYNLIGENPGKIENINSDISGLTLSYTPSSLILKEAVIIEKDPVKVVTIQSTQTLFDLALQYYGSAESVYQLIKENSFIENILSTDYFGKELNYSLNKTVIPAFYRNNNIDVSTRYPYFEADGGIDFLLQEDGYFLLQEDGFKLIL